MCVANRPSRRRSSIQSGQQAKVAQERLAPFSVPQKWDRPPAERLCRLEFDFVPQEEPPGSGIPSLSAADRVPRLSAGILEATLPYVHPNRRYSLSPKWTGSQTRRSWAGHCVYSVHLELVLSIF